MRKLLLIFMCLVLSGCGKNVAIIGGSDGPTSIYISDNENTDITPVKMIKVDGSLYYESGKVSNLTARCGTMDGNLTKTVGEFEIPKNDNECNFEGSTGYQNVTDTTKELPIDDTWVVFKKIVDDEMDFSQYTYCVKVKGRHPNAACDSEYIVLSKDLDITFQKIEKHLFSSLLSDSLDVYLIPVLDEEDSSVIE
ncbi:MAG: hypothetical protein ACI3XA_08725 [Clostridia bacterium]